MRKIDRLLDAVRVGAGHARARDRHRLGRAGDPGRAARRARSRRSRCRREQQPLARRAGRRRRAWPTASTSSCATTAPRTARYDAVVSVEMIEAVGERYWPTYFATLDRLLAPGGRSGSRRSCSSTTGWWRRATSTRGSRSTSSPAARCRRCGRSTRTCASTRSSASPSGSRSAPATRRRCARWRERFDAHADEVDALGFDAHVPADVGLLPRLLRGRVRDRLPRRRAARARASHGA